MTESTLLTSSRASRFRITPDRQRQAIAGGAGIAVGLAFWFTISQLTASTGFPSPFGVIGALGEAVTGSTFYEAASFTVRRILIAWTVSFGLGVIWGLLASRLRILDGLSRPWMLVGLALPSPVAVLFAILLLGLSETTAILGLVLVTTPFVANIVYENTIATPAQLLEMGQAYRFSRSVVLREIILPFLAPALLASARLALQLSWKEVLIMEALARPNGIGERMAFYYEVLQPNKLVAYTIVFAIGLAGVELLIFRRLSRYHSRWRGKTKVA